MNPRRLGYSRKSTIEAYDSLQSHDIEDLLKVEKMTPESTRAKYQKWVRIGSADGTAEQKPTFIPQTREKAPNFNQTSILLMNPPKYYIGIGQLLDKLVRRSNQEKQEPDIVLANDLGKIQTELVNHVTGTYVPSTLNKKKKEEEKKKSSPSPVKTIEHLRPKATQILKGTYKFESREEVEKLLTEWDKFFEAKKESDQNMKEQLKRMKAIKNLTNYQYMVLRARANSQKHKRNILNLYGAGVRDSGHFYIYNAQAKEKAESTFKGYISRKSQKPQNKQNRLSIEITNSLRQSYDQNMSPQTQNFLNSTPTSIKYSPKKFSTEANGRPAK